MPAYAYGQNTPDFQLLSFDSESDYNTKKKNTWSIWLYDYSYISELHARLIGSTDANILY